jgi:hypothetical protein
MRTLAWNEDTVNGYLIGLYKDRTFSYAVADGGKFLEYYGSYVVRRDTIFLAFKGKQPPMRSYLVEEMSGSYLMQFFLDGIKRIFLRKQVPPLLRR